jgi:hypothetical protein
MFLVLENHFDHSQGEQMTAVHRRSWAGLFCAAVIIFYAFSRAYVSDLERVFKAMTSES